MKRGLQRLGNYLNKVEGVILRKNINTIHKLDRRTNSYKEITIDELTSVFHYNKDYINSKSSKYSYNNYYKNVYYFFYYLH